MRKKPRQGQRKKRPPRVPRNGGSDLWAHGYGRAALERMMRIHRKIEDKEYPNCTKMAGEFEVSVRTLKRDIEFMKNSLALPIEFDVPKNGYYFASPQPHFPRVPLTEKETVGLFVAQRSIEQYQGTSLQPVLESAFRKMTAQLDDNVRFSMGNLDEVMSVRPFGPGEAELDKFEVLTKAIRERRVVRFLYRKRGELDTLPKRVHPYRIAYVQNQWMLFAHDPKQKEIVRKFVLFRMSKPELAEERFEISKRFDLNKELEGSLGVFKGSDDYEVVVEFDAWGADDVRGHCWHCSQELTELPKGRLRMTLRLNSLEEVARWVLSFEDHATVTAPKALKERLTRAGRAIESKYAEL